MTAESADPKSDVSTSVANVNEIANSQSPVTSVIDSLVATTALESPSGKTDIRQFMRASTVGDALRHWFGDGFPRDTERLARRLNQDVATIDQLICDQLNVIIHHQKFQELEASWRGLHYLTKCHERYSDPAVKIRVLNMSRKEVERDFEKAVEFDQSQVFKKIYEQEFGTPGGEPYGALVVDYEIHPRPHAGHPHDDISLLRYLSRVGAAAFCPVIANAHPSMLGMDDFQGLEHRVDHARTLSQASYLNWRSLRETIEARFIGLTLPRILMRLPYEDDGSRVDRFCFREDVSSPDASKYLWGGAAFAMGEVMIRAFSQAGWLADIRGLQRDEDRGGLVTQLPVHSFATDKLGIATKMSTDVVVTEELEKELSDLGFVPLCHCKDADFSVFYSNQSIQKPKIYDRPVATVNARISSMLQYMLCVSRFAHYVKVIGREKTGAFLEAQEFEDYLHNWITKYVTADSEAELSVKAKHPLREAKVAVHPVAGRPGNYNCTMHLAPHYELDDLHASVRLVAELTPGRVVPGQ